MELPVKLRLLSQLSLLTLCYILFVNASNVVVDSPFGKIQGAKKLDENTGQSYLSFKGIPYAKPPVGDLRFAKPQPHPNIDGIFDGTKDDLIVCPHHDLLTFGLTNFTEDCLILNILMKDTGSFDSLRKVVVYIHGGGFIFGTSMMHDSKSFVLSQDVIAVTINYRLGVLGFLSTENEASPGNYGLWDQTLAIKWVKDNIQAFGGDPDDITISGESAGGASVGYQALTPHAKGLFTKAYLLSGTASSIFAQSPDAQSDAFEFARSVGCWGENMDSKLFDQESENVVKCLRKLPLANTTLFVRSSLSKKKFAPVVDGDFIPDIPGKILKDDEYLDSVGFFDRTYLISIVNNEKGLVERFMEMTKTAINMKDGLSPEEKESAFQQFLNDCIDLHLSRLGEIASKDKYIVDKVVGFYEKRYFKEDAIIELIADLNMLIPSLDFLVAASRRQSCSSYFLYFNHFPRFVTGPRKGTPHEADLAFWFDFDLDIVEELVDAGIRPDLFDEDDTEIKRMFCDIIGEFAKSGNPGLALKDVLPNGWPKYDVSTSYYLNFNLKPWIDYFLKKDTQDFWLNTVPNLIRSVESSTVVVDSPFGKIQGVKKIDENTRQSYLSFKGIPYAKPPVGDLRFAKPQPHPHINGTIDATKDDLIVCPHHDLLTFGLTNFTEDCLILNILMKDTGSFDSLRKVVVYIHGGGFIFGTSMMHDSKSFVLSQDVIAVTINYRLGVLGFLSTENEASPGNYGLWDQTLAIKWVKDNIQAFGGDPDDITISGESAGGASVGYQALTPHAKGLFTKAYLLSGTASSIFAQSPDAQSDAFEFARSVGCWGENMDSKLFDQESENVVKCLRKLPLANTTLFVRSSLSKKKFAPVVDGDFIPDIPGKILKDDEYLDSVGFFDRTYLISIVNNEKGLVERFMEMTKTAINMKDGLSPEEKESAFQQFLNDCIDLHLSRLGEIASKDKYIVDKVVGFYEKRYFKEDAIIELIADLNMLIPSLDFLVAASRRQSCSSYFLYFNHFPRFVTGPRKGTPHEADLAFWFDFDLDIVEELVDAGIRPDLFDEDDTEIKRMFCDIIGEFAKSGNPGLALKDVLPNGWPKYDVSTSYYLNFNLKPWIDYFLKKDTQDFWLNTVPNLIRSVESSTVVVNSPFGKIQGVKKIDENTRQSYLSFKGIPYAKPPVGDLRFAKPQPHPHINGTIDATKDDLIVCPHPDTLTFGLTNFTEDCLILNILMKDTGTFDSLRKVIVYIHGGGFIFGTSMMHDSKSFVITQDVITVTINYRLGVLGFLSTENEASPGNYGLWDQTLAIKWVKDNIRAFGGDPDDITITGESAGGSSVGYQALTPYAKGLFTKAYLLSGTASSVFARSAYAQADALAFARTVGCWKEDANSSINIQESRHVMKCLRKLPLADITSFAIADASKAQFVPRVDGDYVPDNPAKLLKDDEYLDSVGFFNLTYLISIVNNEVGVEESLIKMTKTAINMKDDLSPEEKESAFQQFVNDCRDLQLSRLGEIASKDKDIVDKVVDFYEKRYPKENIIAELAVDLNTFIPSMDFLVAASRRQSCSSYLLYFNHFPRFVTGPRKGTPHEADLAFWFDYDLNFVEELVDAGIRPELFDEDDIEIKRMFSAIIGEFAKSGNPGLALKGVLSNGWPKYDVNTSYYLDFNMKPWIHNFLKKDKQDFWLNIVPKLIRS